MRIISILARDPHGRLLGAAIGCLALTLLVTGCQTTEGQGRRGAGPQAVAVQTTTIQRISVQRRIDLAGTLLSPDQARVSSEVAGVVQTIAVELGHEVRVGDVLVQLEPRELILALERAESALRQTEAQLGVDRSEDKHLPPDDQIAAIRTAVANRDDARAQLNRAQRMVGQGLLPQVELENAQTRLKVAEANYEAAIDAVHSLKASLADRRSSYELAQKKLADAVIKAPVAGSVAERLVQPGEFIRENTPVVTLVQMNPLKLRTAVQERYAGSIRPGLPVQFRVEPFPGAVFEGKVAYVSPAVDQTTRTFVVEALVENGDRRLKPGLFAKGTIVFRQDDQVMAVSDDAISTLAGVSSVYIVQDGKIRQQTVTLGEHPGDLFEIVDGLKGDEVLASSNLSQLATGTPVRLESASDPATAGDGGATGGRGRGRGPGPGQPGDRR